MRVAVSIGVDAVKGSSPADGWCEALYEALAAALMLYGRALGLSHAEAEDVLQDVFRELLRRDEAPRQPEHYLIRAFRNRALKFRRSLWRRVAREFESRRWFELEPGDSACERAAMKCLAALPPEQREVIVLKLWHRHTFEEIAEPLDLSPHTAAGRYRYGLQKLRVCLREPAAEHEHELDGSLGETALGLDTPPAFPGA